eukprot:CAMPEP_0118652074 /NCGR_PEP_ID=MMETSP0785-20121206/11122_1 /TAXON_ID=91992 /ORGANISM="Bolidomonas pacifica, Strain CCMP 1866" /LENGTH=155 /DNA_ID=CAMNT_0006544563 /DNA_START=9 /DNA_END=472 /DNA_ORIENTATION=+
MITLITLITLLTSPAHGFIPTLTTPILPITTRSPNNTPNPPPSLPTSHPFTPSTSLYSTPHSTDPSTTLNLPTRVLSPLRCLSKSLIALPIALKVTLPITLLLPSPSHAIGWGGNKQRPQQYEPPIVNFEGRAFEGSDDTWVMEGEQHVENEVEG